jgi:hypothetical protein
MLIVLILIAWLTIVAIVVNACRSAARGDEMLQQDPAPVPAPQSPGRIGGVAWADGPALGVRHTAHVGTADRPRVSSVRARGGQCAAGS